MHARVTTLQALPDRLEEGIRMFREQTEPLLQGQAGIRAPPRPRGPRRPD